MKYFVDVDRRVDLPFDIKQKYWTMPCFVSFAGSVTEESARKFIDEFEASEAMAIKAGQEVLPIVIDSFGGSVYDAFGMVDAVKACSLPVATIVESKAMSAGALLFTCGSPGHRYVGPNATIMIHQVSTVVPGRNKPEDMKASSDEVQRLNNRMFEMMAENCGKKDPEHFKDVVHQKCRNGDWYLTPEEALREGIANHIRIPSMKINVKMDYKFE